MELAHINTTSDEKTIVFSLIENDINFYKKNILDIFKKIDENNREKIHAHNFKLGKNTVFNSELLKPELMNIRFALWSIFYEVKYKSTEH